MTDEEKIRLYIDEDVWAGLAAALREKGYDAVDVHEADRGNKNIGDEEQLEFAVLQQRAFLVYNKKHFVPISIEWWQAGKPHFGIIVSVHLPQGELLRRVLNLLERETAKSIENQVIHLEAYK
jgi:predicted nuclease of predicted toxin-antitoxin system